MFNIDQAREWAERRRNISDSQLNAGVKAAAEIIQSLPDQWVDVEKLREVVRKYEGNTYISEIVQDFADLLPTPKLPTLADMTPEEQKACRWMQATAIDGEKSARGVIQDVYADVVWVMFHNGFRNNYRLEDVTPLPDLPKLEWPGGVVDCEIVEEPETVDAPPAEKAALPKPEDVPANEPWLIEVDGQEAIGTRYKGDTRAPWAVAALNGLYAGEYSDNAVTLIHKLVPETHTLPEGMRLADHALYGRVVVSPKVDADGGYKVFLSNHRVDDEHRVSWGYAYKYELTFLDGNQ